MSPAQFRLAQRLMKGEKLPTHRFLPQWGPLRSFIRQGFVDGFQVDWRPRVWKLTAAGKAAYLRELGPKHLREAKARDFREENGFYQGPLAELTS